MKRKKIVIVAYDLNPYLGSESKQAFNWLKVVSKHYDVELFVRAKHRGDIKQYENGIHVKFNFIQQGITAFLFDRLKLYNLVYHDFIKRAETLIVQTVQQQEISLIHYLTPSGIHSFNNLYLTINIPYIVGPLGGGLRTPKGFSKLFRLRDKIKNLLRTWFYLRLMKNKKLQNYFNHARKILIGTEYLLDYIPSKAREKVEVFFDTFVDLSDFKEEKKMHRDNDVQIVFSGTLTPVKGLFLLLEAVALLRKKYGNNRNTFKVIIVGAGSLNSVAKQWVGRNGLCDFVKFMGRIPRKDVLLLLSKSDIFCLPTIRDHGGGAILEAMAAGLPIVTSDCGGPKFSVTPECGFKIPVISYEQYVHDLTKVLAELIYNPELREKLGRKARERVEREYSIEAIEKRILNIYNEVLN